jgi:two-component system, NarL family, nitrate/nitrite response regulator NarL
MQHQENSANEAIRVLVADRTHMHTRLLTDALRLDPALEVVAGHSADLIETAAKHNVSVSVISSHLEEDPKRGLEVLRELRAALPTVRAILLLDSSKRETILEAFQAGARGVFSHYESLENLCKCVRQVHAGQIWASSQQISFAVEALAATPTVRAVDARGFDLLSKRELEVVRSLAGGLTNREIAERLGLSQHTIKNYLFRVFDKLGVSSRMELLCLTLTQPATRVPEEAMGVGKEHGNSDVAGDRKAAEQGLPNAQIALAEMYSQGKNIEKNDVTAYMWYLISEQTTAELKDIVITAKRKLAESLTTEEILEAQQKASAHLKKSAKPASYPSQNGLAAAARVLA